LASIAKVLAEFQRAIFAGANANTAVAEQLRDIHLPSPVSWWPLSILTWLTLLIVIVFAGLFLGWLLQRRRQASVETIALLQMQGCYRDWCTHESTAEYLEQMTIVLKRFALTTHARKHVASLNGSAWASWLNQCSSVTLSEAAVRALTIECYWQTPSADVDKLHAELIAWMASFPSPTRCAGDA